MANSLYAAELMVYFEKNRFLEVIEALFVKLALERPLSIKHYIKRFLRKIANSVLFKNTLVHLPTHLDAESFAISCCKLENIPLLFIPKGFSENNFIEAMQEFESFCNKNGLHKKNKIILNSSGNLNRILKIKNILSPTNFILVNGENQVRLDFKDFSDFNHQVLKQNPTTNSSCQNTEALAANTMNKIRYNPLLVKSRSGGSFLYRTVFMGIRGSGTKTQAKLLASRYNLIYINVEKLIEQTLQSNEPTDKILAVALKKQKEVFCPALTALVWRRILQRDTLSNGWVIVGYPNCLDELKVMVEKFETPPNRFVTVHCCKNIAMRRLIQKWEKDDYQFQTENTISRLEEEFANYDQNIQEISNYLKASTLKTIYVDGAGCRTAIKNKIFAFSEF